jgi:hypothetical protein
LQHTLIPRGIIMTYKNSHALGIEVRSREFDSLKCSFRCFQRTLLWKLFSWTSYSSYNNSIHWYLAESSWHIVLLGQYLNTLRCYHEQSWKYLDTSIPEESRYIPVPRYLHTDTLCKIWPELQFFKCRFQYSIIHSYPAVSSWLAILRE